MATKFIVNGREYPTVEEMPADVRQVYDAALGRLPDDNKNGVPDILERGSADKVIAIRHSEVSANGGSLSDESDLPDVMRRLLDQVSSPLAVKRTRFRQETSTTGSTDSQAAVDSQALPFPATNEPLPARPSHDHDGLLAALDRVAWTLGKVLQGIVVAAAIAVLVGGVWIIQNLDAGSKAQGGVFYIGVGMLLAEGWLIKTYFSLGRRG